MKETYVSVILPNYNYAIYLPERIDSILKQTYQDFELIILDDCSTDNSRAIIEQYRDNTHVTNIVYNSQNTGSPFFQWKKGIELAKGSLVWIAESDDVAHPNFLSTLVSQMDKHPQAALAFSHSLLIDENGCNLNINKHKDNSPCKILLHLGRCFARNEMLLRNDIYNASMVVFRRDIFSRIDNGYLKYKACGDWFFWMHVCLQGDVIEVCQQLNYYRQHLQKVTTNAGRSGYDWREVIDLLNEFQRILQLKGFSYHLFRGHWTKDFMESGYVDKSSLINHYPKVLGGRWWEVFCYRLSILIKKVLGKKRF